MRTNFDDDALFKKADFKETAHYQNVEFGGEASFSGSTFGGATRFRYAQFEEEASISYVEFQEDTFFSKTEFEGYCSFYESTFHGDADFRGIVLHKVGRFMNATFERNTYFNQSRIMGEADFSGADFDDQVIFVRSIFEDEFSLRESYMKFGVFKNLQLNNETPVIDLSDSQLSEGHIEQNSDEPIYFDLTDGMLGDVDIDMECTEQMFYRFRFLRTEFDGFDFSKYRSHLSPKWIIHESAPQLSSDVATEPEDLETTYLKAKNGATQVGDNRSASKFFVREMLYRRRTHKEQAVQSRDSSTLRIKAVSFWLMNYFFSVTCGYGEKPHRVLFFSVGTVLVYAGIFALLLSSVPYDTRLGYFVLSLESFTTLVIGGGATIEDPTARLIADTEGFLGGFLIALFVFALTRSVHR